MSEHAVRVERLVVRFGELAAVDGVSFAVAPGEIYGLLGPNGAGKTTTLRVLTTLLKPTEGEASVAGFDVRRDGLAVRSSIGYVPQAISVDAALTGRENLDFYARVTGVPRRERRRRVEAAIDAMLLEQFVDRLARTLSGGMLRRLEIASALLNEPRVLFLDEPTVGLDPSARRLVWERLHALRAEVGTTLLVTTHMMEEAEAHCDRVGIVDHGRLVGEGTPTALRDEQRVASLEEVFVALTGHGLEQGGGMRGVRSQRRLARRLG